MKATKAIRRVETVFISELCLVVPVTGLDARNGENIRLRRMSSQIVPVARSFAMFKESDATLIVIHYITIPPSTAIT